MSDFLPPKDKLCKYTGFEKSCRALVCEGKCTGNWVNLHGKHPQTGRDMDHWGCASELVYLVTLEAAKQASGAAAASQILRNMIFDPEVRARELAKATDMKTIEAKTCELQS